MMCFSFVNLHLMLLEQFFAEEQDLDFLIKAQGGPVVEVISFSSEFCQE